MSTTGDLSVLLRRRASITATAPACPVCGRPIAPFTSAAPKDRRRGMVRSAACSTTCLVALRQIKAQP